MRLLLLSNLWMNYLNQSITWVLQKCSSWRTWRNEILHFLFPIITLTLTQICPYSSASFVCMVTSNCDIIAFLMHALMVGEWLNDNPHTSGVQYYSAMYQNISYSKGLCSHCKSLVPTARIRCPNPWANICSYATQINIFSEHCE